MGVPLWLLRVECRLETLVALDDTIDVGLVHGGHTDGERHFVSIHSKSLFKKMSNTIIGNKKFGKKSEVEKNPATKK
jgi:hypothetical protein